MPPGILGPFLHQPFQSVETCGPPGVAFDLDEYGP